MRKFFTAAAIVTFALAGTASASLVNFYDFNDDTLNDTAGTYDQGKGVTGSQNATNLTMADASGLLGTVYVAGGTADKGKNYNPAVTTQKYLFIQDAVSYSGFTGYSEALTWPSNDVDVNLGSNFTYEMWMKANTSYSPSSYAKFMTANNYGIDFPGINPYGSGTNGVAQYTMTGGTSSTLATNMNGYAGWHHLAIVADGTAGTYTVYLDGVSNATGTFDPGTFGTTTALKIGVSEWSTSNSFAHGTQVYVDDIAMWNEALSQATITNHQTSYGLTITSTPTWHPGDANKDGQIDLQDFGLLKDNFGIPIGGGAVWGQGDFNSDGGVDLQDFGILKDHFGHSAGDPIVAIPEPATMSLLVLAGLGLLRKRTR